MPRRAVDISGKRFGKWTVLERVENKGKSAAWKCRCDCGKEAVVIAQKLVSGKSLSCGCSRIIDLTGLRFGRLTVLGQNGRRGASILWRCRCDCGNELSVSGNSLRNGKATSCGCRRVVDIAGMTFGRLTVIERAGVVKNRMMWRCRCTCGKEIIVAGASLRSGNTMSCGCYNRDKITKHGLHKSRLYKIWRGMRERCYNTNTKNFMRYGGRGISICEEWLEFDAFKDWALSHGYTDKLTIDRIDNEKGYSPDNCRWATLKEQENNKYSNRIIEFNGEKHTISEWSDITGICYSTLHGRLERYNIEKALTAPVRPHRIHKSSTK